MFVVLVGKPHIWPLFSGGSLCQCLPATVGDACVTGTLLREPHSIHDAHAAAPTGGLSPPGENPLGSKH